MTFRTQRIDAHGRHVPCAGIARLIYNLFAAGYNAIEISGRLRRRGYHSVTIRGVERIQQEIVSGVSYEQQAAALRRAVTLAVATAIEPLPPKYRQLRRRQPRTVENSKRRPQLKSDRFERLAAISRQYQAR